MCWPPILPASFLSCATISPSTYIWCPVAKYVPNSRRGVSGDTDTYGLRNTWESTLLIIILLVVGRFLSEDLLLSSFSSILVTPFCLLSWASLFDNIKLSSYYRGHYRLYTFSIIKHALFTRGLEVTIIFLKSAKVHNSH